MLKPFTKIIEQSPEEITSGQVETIFTFDGKNLEINVNDGGEGIGLSRTDQLALRDVLLELYPVHAVQKDY